MMSDESDKNLNMLVSDEMNNMTLSEISCDVCKSQIAGKVISALGKYYHPDHFVCFHCKEKLSGQFVEKDDQIYCKKDYRHLFHPKCFKCNQSIVEKCIVALDKLWHPEHFQCEECGKTFDDNNGFHEKDGRIYCHKDYLNTFAKKCFECQKPIEEKYVTALDQSWHLDCFRCRQCQQCLGSDTGFFEKDRILYCRQDYFDLFAPKCTECGEPITDKFVLAEKRQWHPDCYIKK